MKKIKVLHIHWKGHTGGAERFLRDIITYSDTDRFEHAICFLAQGDQLASQLKAFNPPIFELGMKSGTSIREGFKFLNVLKTFKPDIIHGHTRNYFINVLLLAYPKLLKVYSEHGGGFEPTAPGGDIDRYEKFYRFFISRYNLVLTNAEYLREKILAWTKLANVQVKIYFYGIEITRYGDRSHTESLRKEWGIPPEAKVIGIVGRLVEQKGIDDFIKIASEIQKSNKECRFVVVGDGPLRPMLEKMTQDLKVEILFLGDRQDLPKLLPAFDIFVFT